jgi:lipoprotein NlpD
MALLLSACASSTGMAPVEDRQPTGRARVPAPAPAKVQVAPPPPPVVAAPVTPAPRPRGWQNEGKPGHYTVRGGDVLTRIGLEHGQSWRDLARWNEIEDPNLIEVGQVLRVIPPDVEPGRAAAIAVTQTGRIESRSLELPPAAASMPSPAAASGPRPVGNSAALANTAPLATAPLPPAPPAPPARAAVAPAGGAQPSPAAAASGMSPGTPARVASAAVPSSTPIATPTPTATPITAAVPAALPTTAGAAPPAAPPLPAAPATSASRGGDDAIDWAWPVAGPVIAVFDEGRGVKGVSIGGEAGTPVLAAADGRVVYAGSGLRGYGNLLILKHNNTYLTAYAHNQKLLVREDQVVRRGQPIAEMGASDAERVKLHFEVRRMGKPVDPVQLLPTRP